MKKSFLLFAGLALATTAANAQDVTPANTTTEVEVRDNGTVKTTTKTGKTNVGEALDNTKDAAGNIADKTGNAVKRAARKTSKTAKRAARNTSNAAKKGTRKLKEKTE
ncbi:hypothetical protein [Hymenobacter sp. IS2118]|uniref:hypothetical protein n=1 Tax=Hymenobacter sp. IS2118 TaxID=1505605 RepID=UPI00055986CA|nr:hypothetical protein [Hymenobacter sp. IS2118]